MRYLIVVLSVLFITNLAYAGYTDMSDGLDTAFADDHYLKLDQTTPQTTIGTFSFPEVRQTSSGSVTRNADNYITAKTITGGKTYTYTRNADNYVTDFTDGTLTWTLTRNADGYITSWTVS